MATLSKKMTEDMHVVIVGHVDHGKSTIIGRLLADTGSLPEGKLDQVREMCRRTAKPFEYAFLLDALKDEREQGITIDTARSFFKTEKRNYIIIDAPGHIEFLKNMITGAARAEAAVLVIDAFEGIRENSKRHGYLLSFLGIRQVTVVINKMDLIDFSKEKYDQTVAEYKNFLSNLDLRDVTFVPVSGFHGDNIVSRSSKMSWYQGLSLLDTLENFKNSSSQGEKPFRMPVQGVYKFTKNGDDRRIIAGTVETGNLKTGDEIVFYPSGKKTRVKSIESFNAKAPLTSISEGYASGFTMTEQIYVTRGEVTCKVSDPKPKLTSVFTANLFWLGRQPLVKNKNYQLKINSMKVEVTLASIKKIIDASSLDAVRKESIERHEVAECTFKTSKAIAFDLISEIPSMGRFVLVDGYEISGGGIITEALPDSQSDFREKVLVRNTKWTHSGIAMEKRAERYNQKPSLILITGNKDTGKKRIAKAIEMKLFEEGKFVYFLGIGNLLYGVDADLKRQITPNREEHLRRLAEVANIILDTGQILIVTAIDLTQKELEIIRTSIDPFPINTIWNGDKISTDIRYDLHLSEESPETESVLKVKELLQMRQIIFKPF